MQIQKGPAYKLTIPAAVYIENERAVNMIDIEMSKKTGSFTFSFDRKPVRIDVDPFFDIFRRLSDEEIPPSLSRVFGSKEVLIILSGKGMKKSVNENFKLLAENWASKVGEKIKIINDNDIEKLPSDKDIWLFGWDNRFRPIVENEITRYSSSVNKNIIRIGDKSIDREKNSIVLAVKNPEERSRVIVLLCTDNSKALEGLGRKLPHYGKYSYLAFSGEEPTINLKGQWESDSSPLKKILNRNIKFDHKLPD